MTYKEAIEILFENTAIEIINYFIQTPEYWEFYEESGSDLLRYRIYKDGSIYSK